MNVQPLNPELQQRLHTAQRQLNSGIPSRREVLALADELRFVQCSADDALEVAAAMEDFRQAHDRAFSFNPKKAGGGHAAILMATETIIECALAAKKLMKMKAEGRLSAWKPAQ